MKIINKIILFSLSFVAGNIVIAQSDDCSTATLVSPDLTYCNYQAGSSANATQSLTSCSGGGNADDDVWYQFVANSTEMTIKVDPTVGYDAVIQVFSGNCGSLTSIHCQDVNGLNGSETLAETGFIVGNTYYFRIYHYGVGSGTSTFSFCVFGLAPPDNNTPCNAYPLPTVTPSCNYLTFTNFGSAGSSVPAPPTNSCGGSAPGQGGYAGGDVWFSVIVPPSGELDIQTQGIDFSDGAMALYSGTCSSPTFIHCDDDGDPGDGIIMPHIYETGLTPGATMYIRVWEYNNNNNGEFAICVTTPDNDDCVNAQQICDLNGYGGVTSSAYTIDTPDNMCGIGNPVSPTPGCVFGTGYTGTSPVQIDNNSWLKFTASATVAELFVEISSCQKGNGMQMQIFEGTNCTNFTAVSNFLETTTSQTVIATGLTIGVTYYIVVDGFAGDICSYTISATSGVQVAEAVATSEIICQGESTNLNGTVFGTGTYTYQWEEKDGTFISNNNPITVSPTTSTEYVLAVNGLCGSTSYASIYITVNDNPTANAGSDLITCDNVSTNISATANGGDGTYTYNWDNSLGAGANQTVSPTSTTTYNVTVTDGNGCTDVDAVNVNVNNSPTANAGTDLAICDGQSASLTASGGTTYSWSSGGTSATETVAPVSTTTYSVTVGNANNCFNTDDIQVTVNPLPNAFAGNDITVCNGGSTDITATGGVSYFWSGGLGSGATQTLTNITSNTTYTVTVTDANGCTNTDAIAITVGSALTPDAGQDLSICLGESTDLTASGGVTYSWDNGINVATQTVSPTQTTTYTVNVTDGGSCTGSDAVIITVNGNPTANAGSDVAICEGETANLLATGGSTYSWNQSLGTGDAQSVSPTTTTTYTVTVTNASNCSDTDDIVVTVNANPVILASSTQTICDGGNTQITASGTGISAYTWTDSNGNNLTGQDQTVSPTTSTWYYVSGSNANNCSATDSVEVIVNSTPLIDTSSVQIADASCTNGGGTISGISIIGNGDFTYNWTNGITTIGNTLTIGGLVAGNYTLNITDVNGCTHDIVLPVGFVDISNVAANNDSTETEEITPVSIDAYANDTGNVTTISIVTQPNNGFASYAGNGIFEYTPNPNFVGVDSFTYQICDLTCVDACKIATIRITVTESGEIVIPNAFTPNADGFNDYFVITNLEQYENNSIVIFNRWGDKVYEAAPYLNDWDGSSENAKLVLTGDKVVDGTYYFILDLGDKETELINGFIDLRRE